MKGAKHTEPSMKRNLHSPLTHTHAHSCNSSPASIAHCCIFNLNFWHLLVFGVRAHPSHRSCIIKKKHSCGLIRDSLTLLRARSTFHCIPQSLPSPLPPSTPFHTSDRSYWCLNRVGVRCSHRWGTPQSDRLWLCTAFPSPPVPLTGASFCARRRLKIVYHRTQFSRIPSTIWVKRERDGFHRVDSRVSKEEKTRETWRRVRLKWAVKGPLGMCGKMCVEECGFLSFVN